MARRSPTSRSTSAPATIVVKHVYAAMDCGLAVNPALVENQIEAR